MDSLLGLQEVDNQGLSAVVIPVQADARLSGNCLCARGRNIQRKEIAQIGDRLATVLGKFPGDALVGDKFKMSSIIRIKPTKVSPILAPSYQFYSETTREEMQIEAARQMYGL